jgi:outer membrane protein OmpA-like peptidoglycan-associated protein
MRPSFAHFPVTRHARLCGLAIAFAVAGCASLPPPTAELDAAQQAVARADAADGDQYAAPQLSQARAGLERAQAAMARGRDEEARSAALAANADADLAHVLSRAAVTRAELAQQQAQVAELRRRLQMDPAGPVQDPLDVAPATAPAAQRLQLLDADTRLNPFAQYERLLAAAQAAGKRERAAAEQLAERRVGIAEQAARIEAARREIDRLERERSELMVEASRRDAERARAEAERLRIEAQVQAEEAARLRAQAEQAEAVLDTAQIDQDARVAAAREKEAALARQEAELVAGAKLPPSRKDPRGEVFTLAGDAFGSGQSQLTTTAAASVRALGIYLKALGAGSAQVLGHTDSQGEAEANRTLSQRRADAVRAALANAGFAAGRISAQGQGEDAPVADNMTAAGRAKNRRVEIVIAN